MPYSYHSHSGQYCHHGHGQLEDVVKEAIRKGFHAYGLTEHMPRFADSELYPEEIEVRLFFLIIMIQHDMFIIDTFIFSFHIFRNMVFINIIKLG